MQRSRTPSSPGQSAAAAISALTSSSDEIFGNGRPSRGVSSPAVGSSAAAAVDEQKSVELAHRRKPARQRSRRQPARSPRCEIVVQRRGIGASSASAARRRETPQDRPDRCGRPPGSAAPRRARPPASRERLRAARDRIAGSWLCAGRALRSLREARIGQHLLDRRRRRRDSKRPGKPCRRAIASAITMTRMTTVTFPMPRPHSLCHSSVAPLPIDEQAARYASTLSSGAGGRAVRKRRRALDLQTSAADRNERRNPRFRAAPDHCPGRSDGRRQDQDRPPAGGPARVCRFSIRTRDRGRRRRDHRGDLSQPRRARVSRRRAPGHRAAARAAGPCSGDRRRRLYGPGDPRADRAPRRLGVAARRSRRAGGAGVAPQQPAAVEGRRPASRPRRADRAAPPDLCRGRYRRRQRRRLAGSDGNARIAALAACPLAR